MSRPSRSVADPARDEDHRLGRTALAFLLAPGIAALAGGFILAALSLSSEPLGPLGDPGQLGEAVLGAVLFGFYFGLVGYVTAGLVSAPLYLILPARVSDRPVAVVVLAGGSAAAPWLAFSPFAGAGLLVGAAAAFPLGCVAGIAFVLIRGAPSSRPH